MGGGLCAGQAEIVHTICGRPGRMRTGGQAAGLPEMKERAVRAVQPNSSLTLALTRSLKDEVADEDPDYELELELERRDSVSEALLSERAAAYQDLGSPDLLKRVQFDIGKAVAVVLWPRATTTSASSRFDPG